MDKTISITVDVEEWFHTEWFDVEKVINKYYNGKYPKTDVEDCVNNLIELFNRYEINATFFVLGETAERYPGLITSIRENDHEIACHGYYHNKFYDSLQEFREDIIKFKKRVEDEILGFRFPNFIFSNDTLSILCDEGFVYDSTIVPCRRIRGWYGNPDLPLGPFKYSFGQDYLIEFPIAVCPYLRLPGGGGWYLRNIGYLWINSIVKCLIKKCGHATLYIHPWEISSNNPSYNEIPFHVFRKTGKATLKKIEILLKNFRYLRFENLKSLIKDDSYEYENF